MSVIPITSSIHNYEVRFVSDSKFFSDIVTTWPMRCWIVDENVWDLYAGSFLAPLRGEPVIIQPISEDLKSHESVFSLYERLVDFPAKRNLTLVSIGGGILQDITGFAASTLYRGLPWIYIPTTLLAQADSCIGSKTSLNLGSYKNLIGTYYPPFKVYLYTPFVQTQDAPSYGSGLGEIVKLAITNKRTPEYIAEMIKALKMRKPEMVIEAVKESLLVKKAYIERDEFDMGVRNLLNYGHCVGHAVETATGYSVPHGQAVVLGMLVANLVSTHRGLLSKNLADRIAVNALWPVLPESLHKPVFNNILVRAMQKDKKRTGNKLSMILLNEEGTLVKVNDVEDSEVLKALEEIWPEN